MVRETIAFIDLSPPQLQSRFPPRYLSPSHGSMLVWCVVLWGAQQGLRDGEWNLATLACRDWGVYAGEMAVLSPFCFRREQRSSRDDS
jgi:hypothetical protein